MTSDNPIIGKTCLCSNMSERNYFLRLCSLIVLLFVSFNLSGQTCISAVSVDPVEICETGALNLVPVLSDGLAPFVYNWAGPDGFSSSESYVLIEGITPDQSGTYSLTVTDADMCIVNTDAEVTVFELPVVSLEPVEVLCENSDPIELIVSPIGGVLSGSGVVDGFFDPSLALGAETSITYSFTDSNGCTDSETIIAKVQQSDQLVCKGDLNVSLDYDCLLGNLTVQLFIEDHLDPDFYTFRLKDQFDNIIELDEVGDFAGECIVFEVIDICSGNSCWGNLCIEDKLPPSELNCECETPYMDDGNGNLIENPNCVFYCYDLWDLEILEAEGDNNEILPSVFTSAPVDNCFEFDNPSVFLQILPDGDDCSTKRVLRSISYNYLNYDGSYETIECVQTFLFKPVDFDSFGLTDNGAWDDSPDIFHATYHDGAFAYYLPEKSIEMPCGSDLSPESIAAHYDLNTPGRPDGVESDDYEETPNIIEHQEGIPYGYPYVVVQGWNAYHAKPVLNNICNLYAVYSDQVAEACGDGCNGGQIVARSWELLDWCSGDASTWVQNVSSKDKEAPTISTPDITVSVDPWDCSADVAMPYPEHLYDACDDNPVWTIIPPAGYNQLDNTIIGLDKGTYQAWYEASDCCGNTTLYPVVINVIDRAAPIAITNENIVLNLTTVLGGDGVAKLYAKDVDNFSYDPCGPVKLEVRRADGNIWCHEGNATFNNDGHADDGPNDDDDGEYVIFCCEDVLLQQDDDGTYFGVYDVILRVWDDGDMNGIFGTFGDNYNEVWTSVRVEDKLIPTVVCPSNVEIECHEDFNDYSVVGRPYVYTSCGEIDCEDFNDTYTRKRANFAPFLGEEIQAYNPTCREGAIRRTWNCEGQTCTQWIIVRADDTYEIEITWPQDTVINCLGEALEEPTFIESACELAGVSLEVDTFIFEDGACYKFLKHWTIISWCDYDVTDSDLNEVIDAEDDGFVPGLYQHTQVVKLLDEDKPIVLASHQVVGTNADCVTEGAYITAKATDEGACASDWIKWDVEIDLGGTGTYEYSYSSGLPPSDPFYIGPTSSSFTDSLDLGNQVQILLPDGIAANCGYQHRVRYSAYDGCGNVTRVTKNLEIKDTKAPTPYMIDASSAVMESGGVELWASDFNIGSFDNCSDGSQLWYTFSSNIPPQLIDGSEVDPWYNADGVASQDDFGNGIAEKWNPVLGSSSMIFDCDDVEAAQNNGGTFFLNVYVWDACYNTDFAIVNLNIIDNQGACGPANRASVAGKVITENGEGVVDLMVEMTSEQPNYPAQNMTIQDGSFAFGNNPLNNNYVISGEKNDDWLNGVTTLDLVLIQRHILGLTPFDSPYKMIAADASNDENISAIDLIVIRKLIIGVSETYPNNDSWRLVDAKDNLNISNPWPFNERIVVENLDNDMSNQDFIGVKVGDVNGSVTANFQNVTTEERSSKVLNLNFDNRSVQRDEFVKLEITSDNFEAIYGLQFSLKTIGMEILSVDSGLLEINADNYRIEKEHLIFSWNKIDALDLKEGTLFTINLKANQSNDLKNLIALSDEFANAEAYQGDDIETIDLKLNEKVDQSLIFKLDQNEPNPWLGETTIGFTLPQAGIANITIYDITGKRVYTHSSNYERGSHQLTIKEKDIAGSNAVLYYKIDSGDQAAVKKMIMLYD